MRTPNWYELALAERGVKEVPGAANNPIVRAYYKDARHKEIVHDSVRARPLSAPCFPAPASSRQARSPRAPI